MKKGTVKQRLISALLAMVMLITSLIGTTFSWFTDTKTSEGNIIEAGTLKLDLIHKTASGDVSLKDKSTHKIFDYDKWEPGYTRIETLEVMNLGTLAFKYRLSLEVADNTAVLGDNGEFLGDVIDVYVAYGDVAGGTVEEIAASSAWVKKGTLTEVLDNPYSFISGQLLPNGRVPEANSPAHTEVGRQTLKIALHMNKKAGNDYQDLSVGDVYVNLKATQYDYENDSLGNGYDSGAGFPSFSGDYSASASVNVNASGALVDEVTLKSGNEEITAIIPAGTSLIDGTTTVTLDVTTLNSTKSNVELYENEILNSVDVHVSGIKEGNATPILVTVKKLLAPGLNMGNFALYHVEDGVTVKMTYEDDLAALDAHNEFIYDPATGDVTMALCSFSEIALVANTVNAWNGTVATAFAGGSGTETDPYLIANADQLAYFGAVVGGMKGDENGKTFEGEYIKLIADINLGDKESENNPDLIFYPIGYYNSEGTYEKTGTAITSGLRKFSGIFDGNGNTISNFYHNTWEMKGDNEYYAASEQYYRDGMGLFGKIYKGTVKNLTVKNFSSDGEYTTTGVIAAYADGATFENIAISDCNPRVYNIGNGGIVGCVGWYAQEVDLKTTFTNITVDNSNKISALWGSYDVACGGIAGQYYPTSGQTSAGTPKNAGIEFVNCHVSAQMDVYNDVCANYQYYAYRYTGMLIGSVRENETIDGHVYPKMDGITASGCTVHFGTWNDYYYCEIIDNTIASYTHDYQMSRLTEIKAIDGTTITYLDGTTGTVPASGRANYVIVDYTKGHGTDNATCYHFKDGKVWNHSDAGEEMVDGVKVLVEDKQHLYLEFNNLVTGYGWGVTSRSLTNLNGVTNLDVTSGDQEASVEKFDVLKSELTNNRVYKLSAIFAYLENCGVKLVPGALTVGIANLDENGNVSADIDYDRDNWENSTIKFSGTGNIKLTIQDYYFCTPTELTVNITERQPEVKFDVVMNNGDFLHRVGNIGTVALDRLFKAKDGVEIGTVSVTVEAIDNTSASGKYSNNAIQFIGTGVVKVTVTDNDYCIPTELYLEVVDAVNATTATSATKNNVVLLNDMGFSSLKVSGGYTLYGNGFTMTCSGDSAALDMGYAFVTLSNGTLDNVQIVCPNFDYAVLYKSNMTESGNRKETTDKTRYFNVKSGVMVSGNSQILNSRISGGRAAVNVSGGNCVIDNSRIELGAVASILVGSANSLKLKDVTLIQKPTASTYDSNKKLMGFSVLYLCDSEGKATPTTLNGSFVQQAWVNADDKQYVPSAGQDIVDGVMKETAFIHNINGKDSLNLGFAYMPEDAQKTVAAPDNITDNRTDKATIPYEMKDVKIQIAILSTTVYVYSYNNSNGTADSFKTESEYKPNKQSDIITVNYSDTADGLTTDKSFGTDGWVYELNVDLDKLSGYALDFSKLSMSVNGVAITDFKVNGNAKPTSPVAVTAGGTTYTLTATVDGTEYTATYKVTGTETSKESPSLVASNYGAGLCVASSYGGTWHGAAPALEGIQIKYWSVAEGQYKTITLSDYTPTTAGKLNGTDTTWTYSPDNGDFTLTLTGGQVHSGNSVNAMPVVCDDKLYFVAASSKGLVNSGNSARTIPVSYSFKDNNNGDVLTFSHTWSVSENKDEQYKYSDFCNGTLKKLEASSGGITECITPDTLITLADGTQVRVDSLKGNEELLVWNMETGKLDKAPIMFVDSEAEAAYEVIKLYFSDGTEVKVISEHGFWDYDLNKYVYLDRNAADYIGHTFAKQNGDTLERVQLVNVVIETELTTAWSPVTEGHLCYFVNGMLSMPGGVGGLFNIFDVDPETMTYDYEAMQRDIETYGLYTYEELNAICPLSEEMFNAAGGAYLKISIGKGNLTEEELFEMISRYSKFFD
ncbi:MAG: SipW-dependent-type signal peptide-containing protein [Clostridia bacterium]|nr:SipW-dependent-type signal peptide-containing protein [Clostridia bacterium]